MGLVSIVIPTRNSGFFLENCLRSIRDSSYPDVEIIIVDGTSTDATLDIAAQYQCTVHMYKPDVAEGLFDAPHKRNYGMERANGEYVYWLDADMELPRALIVEAVSLCVGGADALVIPEDSFGTGMWARAKHLERRCYWNDSTVESPRFFKKSVWDAIGGFDLSLGAGGDDIDLTYKIRECGYVLQRVKNIVRHNEGHLSLWLLFRKRFMYGREMIHYLKKRPVSWFVSYNPVKWVYIKNWKLFLVDPLGTVLFIIMRTGEYTAGILGFLYSFVKARYV